MKRREFITLLGGAAATWPQAVRAQQPTMPVIGFLGASESSAMTKWVAALVQRLRELGWVEGRKIGIEYRWAEGRFERLAGFRSRAGPPQGQHHRCGRRNCCNPCGKTRHVGHPKRLSDSGGPRDQRPGREPGTTGWQRYGPIDVGIRSCWQAL